MAWVLAIILAQSTSANEFQTYNGWINDCVGRMQISLPGPSEVAAYSTKNFSKLFGETEKTSPFEFEDGQIAAYSTGSPITHAASPDETRTLLNLAKNRLESVYQRTRKKGNSNFFEEIHTKPSQGVIYRYNDNYSAVITVGSHLLKTRGGDEGVPWIETKKDLHATLNMKPRAVGEIPHQPGICMPYVFKEDSGTEYRSIATTWRLKEHPDITILLEDEKAEPLSKYIDPAKVTPVRKVEFFWEQNYRDAYRYGDYLWRAMHDVKLANVKGKGIPMEMTRRDGTIDYGYFAAANGDPNAKEDTPNLQFYVLQNSQKAISQGIKPLEKKEFLKLVEEIAASIRHRPTEQP